MRLVNKTIPRKCVAKISDHVTRPANLKLPNAAQAQPVNNRPHLGPPTPHREAARTQARQEAIHRLHTVDIRTAFDTVDHASVWELLDILGSPLKIAGLFRQLYTDARSCVRVNNTDSDTFIISSGVRQGCVASPEHFNCFLDHILQKVLERVPDIQLSSFQLADLEYADDTAILQGPLRDIRRCTSSRKRPRCSVSRSIGKRPRSCVLEMAQTLKTSPTTA